MGRLGWGELLLIAIVVLLLFGASRLPQLGRSLGEGIRNLKKGLTGTEDEPSKDRPPAKDESA